MNRTTSDMIRLFNAFGILAELKMIKKAVKEKIILGLDPGTGVMGYGVILVKGTEVTALQYGVIKLNKLEDHELRLKRIFDRVLALVDEFHPDEVALEAPDRKSVV